MSDIRCVSCGTTREVSGSSSCRCGSSYAVRKNGDVGIQVIPKRLVRRAAYIVTKGKLRENEDGR